MYRLLKLPVVLAVEEVDSVDNQTFIVGLESSLEEELYFESRIHILKAETIS